MNDSSRPAVAVPAAPPVPGFRLGYPEVSPALRFGADEPTPVKLSEKYRPRTLCDVFGQGSAICQLQSFLDAPYPVAFLFDGPTGVGKTSTALALAAELGVDPNWSLIHIKSGEQDGDAVTTALKTLQFSAINGGWKMIIVDEADCISVKASNLWLSALENLPGRSIIVFTTNHPEKFQDRFVDRCERITFRADAETLSLDALTLVKHVWRTETGRDDHPALESLPNVVDRHGNVSFRRVLSALEPMLRAARLSPPPVEPIADTPVPVFSDPAPVPALPEPAGVEPIMASKPRSADRIIAEAIEAYRDAVAATGRINDGHKPVREIWDGLAPAQKSAVTRRLDAVGKDQIHKRGDRLASFVYDCVNGSPVSFPDPVPTDPAPAVADATSDVPGPSIDVPTATTVPGFSPVATRSAEYVILEAIVAYRGNATDGCGWHGNYAARDVYNETDGSLKDDIDLLVLRIGHSSLNAEPVDRFIDLVAYCVYGMDVSFPEPEAVTPVSGFSGPMPVSGGSPEAPTFSIGERVILARVATEGIRGQAGTVVRLVWGTHPEVRLDGFDGSDYPAGHHIANPENVDRPDPVPGFSDPVQGITADEVVGRIDAADSALAGRARLARVRVEPYTPEQRRDRRELEARWATIERERVERAALEAARPIVERQLNPAYGPDPLAHLGHRTSRAWEEMGEYRRADFAAWLAHLGYRPGEADHGPLRLDEQFDAFILECLEGTPVFPTPSDPKPPTGDDDGSDLRPGFPEARRPTLQLDPRPLHGPMGAGPDVAGLVGVVVAELLPGGGVAALPGSGRVGREPLGVIASLVILAHGPDQPVIRFDTAYPLPGDALDERFRNPDLHGRTGVDRLIPDDHRVPARHHRGPARPDPRPDATVPARSFLILAIGHKQYGLTIGGDVMTLEAPDGRQYEVTRGDDSTCSCPDWRMRHEGLPTQGCKHVRALRGVNLLPPVPGFSDRRPRECPGGDLARARLAFGMP